jgi:hypothetical protein
MSAIEKLKSRTEWQSYLITVVVLFADHFLGLDIDPDKLWMLVGATGSYGVSRGLAKGSGSDLDASAPKEENSTSEAPEAEALDAEA